MSEVRINAFWIDSESTPLKEGDIVSAVSSGSFPSVYRGIVVGFTPKRIRVSYKRGNSVYELLREPWQVLKI